jgi:hypothetical protein
MLYSTKVWWKCWSHHKRTCTSWYRHEHILWLPPLKLLARSESILHESISIVCHHKFGGSKIQSHQSSRRTMIE